MYKHVYNSEIMFMNSSLGIIIIIRLVNTVFYTKPRISMSKVTTKAC